jgi:hypothetical protein
MVSSTALLRNLRSFGDGLLVVHRAGLPAVNAGTPAVMAAPATMVFLMNLRRDAI